MGDPAYDVYLPGREFCFSAEDQRNYWTLLTAAFPGLRCYVPPTYDESKRPRPPQLAMHKSLDAAPPYSWVELVFDPSWEPVWETYPPHGYWKMANPILPSGSYERGGQVRTTNFRVVPGYPLECMDKGRIYFRCKKGDKVQMSMARRALRLVAKVATNTKQAIVEYPSWTVSNRTATGSDLWIGHDAARWLREKPYRVTEYNDHRKRGVRPFD